VTPFLIIGNPDNRRVSAFVDAVRAEGGPEPLVFAHRDLLDDLGPLEAVPDTPRWVRVDAVGEDAEVERRLLQLGYVGGDGELDPEHVARRPWRHGEVLAPRQHHRGFTRYLERLDAAFANKPAWRPLSPVPSILRLFDKPATWRRHAQAGLPVPEAIDPAPRTPDDLRAAMRARGWGTAYVKLSCGSSASGLGVFTVEPTERLMTTLARRGDGWFNSLRVLRRSRREDIDAALAFILAAGAHVERAVPKARLEGAFFDLRVLVVDGAPCFTVVRQSTHPITNLHLGGWRGDLATLRRAAPPGALEALYETARRSAAEQGCFQVGVDVLLTRGLGEHRIIEANAFGDLIPGLTLDGRGVYAHQVHRLASRAG